MPPPIHTPADLTRQRWLHHLPLHLEMQHGEARYLLDIEDSLYCNQLAALRVLCEAGLGLALILEGEAAAALACGRLQRVLPEWTLPAVSIYAVTPHRVQAAKIAAVLAILRETFAGWVCVRRRGGAFVVRRRKRASVAGAFCWRR